MAIPQESYMKLVAGATGTGGQHSTIYDSSLIKVGDNIKISGTVKNNGVFSVTDIVVDSTNVYYVLKGKAIVAETSNGSTDPTIQVIRAPGDKLVALGDPTANQGVHVWSTNATSDYSSTDDGWTLNAIQPTLSGSGQKYMFHFADEALRVCNINEQNTSFVKWYGYIQRHQFGFAANDPNDSAVPSGLVFAEWQEHSNILSPPKSTGGLSYGYGVTTQAGTGDSEYFKTSSSNGDLTRGVVLTKKNADANLLVKGDPTTSTTGFTFDDGSDEVLDQSVVGEVISIGTALGTMPSEFLFCTKTSGAAGGTITYSRSYGGSLGGTAPVDIADNATPILERGIGWNIGITDGSNDGDWAEGTYEFHQTFIYDGNQESLPVQMGTGAASIAAFTHGAAGGTALRVSVYADLAYNGRISGGRIYTRISETDDDLILLADIDIVKGVRTSLDGDHVAWTYENGNGFYVVGDSGGNSTAPNLDTYNTINGYSPDVKFNSIGGKNELYKTSVVAGRRAFIANVKTFGFSGELERYGDRLMYSEIGKFDTFLPHNFIDVSKGDYGEYVALETFADRLLAFKHNLVHVINISNPSPASWYLEDTVKYMGVSYPYSVTRTEFGIAWINESGCFLYDGSRVRNLVEKRLGISQSTSSLLDPWYKFAMGSANLKDAMIGYDAMSNSLIMFRSPSHGSDDTNLSYIYDFDSNAWTYNLPLFTEGLIHTNFISDWNNNLTVARYDGSTNTDFIKYLPVPSACSNQELVTKDIDFGMPGITKKVYSVRITYKAGATQANPLKYALNGTQSWSSFATVTLATASAWDIGVFTPSSPQSCQSIQLRFDLPSSGTFEINDITIEYRVIKGKMVT